MSEDILKIPCVLSKQSSIRNGGWRLTFDVPETAANEVKTLVGHENKTVFYMVLVKEEK